MSGMLEQGGLPFPEATAGGSYGHGLAALKKYFLEVLLITLVVMVLSGPVWWAEAVEERVAQLDSSSSSSPVSYLPASLPLSRTS